jgi:hypothetical protein
MPKNAPAASPGPARTTPFWTASPQSASQTWGGPVPRHWRVAPSFSPTRWRSTCLRPSPLSPCPPTSSPPRTAGRPDRRRQGARRQREGNGQNDRPAEEWHGPDRHQPPGSSRPGRNGMRLQIVRYILSLRARGSNADKVASESSTVGNSSMISRPRGRGR